MKVLPLESFALRTYAVPSCTIAIRRHIQESNTFDGHVNVVLEYNLNSLN